MKKGGRRRQRVPLYVFLGIMMLALAQSAWWVVYQVSESTHVRDLELRVLEERAHLAEHELQALGRPLTLDEQRNFLRRFPGLALTRAEESITGLSMVISGERLNQAWDESRSRGRMFILEGGFFILLLLLGVWFQLSAWRRLSDAVRQQSNFISGVTHELKSPLTSIRLYAELLENEQVKPESRIRGATVIREETDRLSTLVEQILRARALDAREMSFDLVPVELGAWLEDRLPNLEARLQTQGRILSWTPGAASQGRSLDAQLWVQADEEALDLVLGNLLDNAVKYSTAHSTITMGLRRQGQWVELSVSDEGVGFHAEESRRLFDRFYRSGNELTRKTKGTGLGLYLVREFVEGMSGHVLAESDGPGRGARFAVLLPLSRKRKV